MDCRIYSQIRVLLIRANQLRIVLLRPRCYHAIGNNLHKWPYLVPPVRFARADTLERSASFQKHGVAGDKIAVGGKEYPSDDWTNVTARVLSHVGANLHLRQGHPLYLLKRRVVDHFYKRFLNSKGNPLFSVHETLSPAVTVQQNFDRLLVPADHPSRRLSDSYYLDCRHMLRAHTSAHQWDLVSRGLDNFLVVGDVYRRDQIDSTHYPVFHQVEGVRLQNLYQLGLRAAASNGFSIFEAGVRTPAKQGVHTAEAVDLVRREMQSCIEELSRALFGSDSKCRWVETTFPFTHPSWELEVFYEDNWLEVLGCGIMEHELLQSAGAGDRIGWAVGFGLERLAMKLFSIPDIRLFWSQDSGFLSQFDVADIMKPIKYKPISAYPQCINDLSFWVPEGFETNDFYDLVRSVGGELVEQVTLVDTFFHPKKEQTSHCYRIVYRHAEKTLTQAEVNIVHKQVEAESVQRLGVLLRPSINSGEVDEYAILELQGELSSKSDLDMSGSFLGDLQYMKDGTPVLSIGHHILFGKCTNLEKHLCVLIKCKSAPQRADSPTNTNCSEYVMKAIIKKKLLFRSRPKPIIADIASK